MLGVMSDELVFTILNYSVLPAWLGLAFAPRSRFTELVVHSGALLGLLAIAYAWLLFGDSPGPQGAHFFSLEGVSRIFTTPRTITACWVHYLVFDLFVGAWEARDCERLGIKHAYVVPSLFLTLMFGPAGLLSWLLVRAAARRARTLREPVPAPPPSSTSP
jgi:hypothetical protein